MFNLPNSKVVYKARCATGGNALRNRLLC